MDNQPVIKAAIQSAVSKGIRDIRRDPNRSIRKLVDLGMQFGKGRNQKSFFTDTQSVLKNSNSVYYALVTSLIRNVDPQTLETFGINIGYMSWTMGAKMIRAYEKERGVNVPWAILLRCNMPAAKPLDLSRLVAEGQALGIFAYFLFVGSQTERLADMLATVAQCHTCAFFLMAEDAATNARLAELDMALPNAMFLPRGGAPEYPDTADTLCRKKRIFSLNCEYSAANADWLLSEPFLKSVVERDYPFLILTPADTCDPETRARVGAEVIALRAAGRYPLYPIDLYADVQRVDHIISDESCMLMLGADGLPIYPAGIGQSYGAELSLEALIRLSMPSVRRHR